MGDYIANARTNWFQIKPGLEPAFRDWFKRLSNLTGGMKLQTDTDRFCILCDGAWPNFDPEDDNLEPISFGQQISKFLHSDSLAVMVETGHDGLRYLGGSAELVDAEGKSAVIDLISEAERVAKKRWPKLKYNPPMST